MNTNLINLYLKVKYLIIYKNGLKITLNIHHLNLSYDIDIILSM